MQLTPNDVTGLGSAGLLAYLVVKEVLAFVSKKPNGDKIYRDINDNLSQIRGDLEQLRGKIGGMEGPYWELKMHEIIKDETVLLSSSQRDLNSNMSKIVDTQNSIILTIGKLVERVVNK